MAWDVNSLFAVAILVMLLMGVGRFARSRPRGATGSLSASARGVPLAACLPVPLDARVGKPPVAPSDRQSAWMPAALFFCLLAGLAISFAGWPALLSAQPNTVSTPSETDSAQPNAARETEQATDTSQENEPATEDAGPADQAQEAAGRSEPQEQAAGEEDARQAAAPQPEKPPTDWRRNFWVVLAVTLAVLIVPFLLASFLASSWRVPEYQGKLTLIFLCFFAALAITIMRWPPKLGIDLKGGAILVYELKDPQDREDQEVEGKDQDDASKAPWLPAGDVDMDKLVTAINRRINPGGIREVTVRPYGARQIEVIIPEVDEAEIERYKKIISSIGTLEFRILANDRDHKLLIERAKREDKNKLFDNDGNLLAWWVSAARGEEEGFDYPEIATRKRVIRDHETLEILVVKDPYNVNGGYLVRSTPDVDQTLRPCVNFTFNSRGGRLFGELTTDNLPDEVSEFSRKLGIILDGYLFSAPAIKSTIRQRGEITGTFTKQEVQDLVDVLNAGALPTELKEEPISTLATGPTLGSDTIRRGRNAIAVSMGLVLVFMVFYYRFAGIVACLAMLTNLVLILGIMILVKAAFTLPGLAGLVLIVGMAVDANVLIFERIREELGRKAALRMAIRNGFARATTTIVDANVTTLITGIVLYVIGTDQVRGFAVTLILGVTLSMFTAIYCSRVVFDIAEKKKWISRLQMMRIIGRTQIDFIGKRRVAAFCSILVIVAGLVGVFGRGRGLLDIDFTGGVSVETLFDEEQNIGTIRRELAELPDLAVSDVQIPGEPRHRRFIINTSSPADKNAEEHLGEIKDKIYQTFGRKLAHYTLVYSLQPTVPPSTEDVSESGESPDEPTPGSQGRRDLPSRALLASADPAAILLAQADSSEEKPSTEPAKKPAKAPVAGPALPKLGAPDADAAPKKTPPAAAEKPQAKAPKPPAPSRPKEPVKEPATAAEPGPEVVQTTTAQLDFGQHKMSHAGLQEKLEDEMKPAGAVGKPFDLTLANQQYQEDEDNERGHNQWTVTVDLPQDQADALFDAVKGKLEKTPYFPSSNTIGGKVASNTRVDAVAALFTSLLCIVGYIWIRFQRVMFGLAAVVALVHDVLITLGVIALSAYVADYLGILLINEFKIGLSVLAAFLTIIGYSLNDTIVVFDRIREVRGKAPALTVEMVNTSINQTLARTLLTSITTLLVVVILYAGGGQGIHAFAFSLVIGVLVGTYSSIFVASPALLWMAQTSSAAHAKRASR